MLTPDDQSLLLPALKAMSHGRRPKFMIHMFDQAPSWAATIDGSSIEVLRRSQMTGAMGR